MTPSISVIPALFRIGLVFFAVLIVMRKTGSLGMSFILGAALLCVFFHLGPLPALQSVYITLLHPKTLTLAITVSLILILSAAMESSGQMQRMLLQFQGIVASPRLNLIIFPALIGLLPMPGGTVFSAPMVKKLSAEQPLGPDELSFINFWFRHIWEYWWPLYPGVLLVIALSRIPGPIFIAWMMPMSVFSLGLGLLTLHRFGLHSQSDTTGQTGNYFSFVKELTPILVVIVFGMGLGGFLEIRVPDFSIGNEIGLILSLTAAICFVFHHNGMSAGEIKRIVLNRQVAKMMFLIFSIFIFKGILEDSRSIDAISGELLALHIPVFLIAALFPFLVGMITGITVAVVGTTVPILIPLIHSTGQAHFILPYLMLALTWGFIGVLLSPLHLCLILSNEFFQADIKKVYRHLFFPCLGMACAGFLYFYLIVFWLGCAAQTFPFVPA